MFVITPGQAQTEDEVEYSTQNEGTTEGDGDRVGRLPERLQVVQPDKGEVVGVQDPDEEQEHSAHKASQVTPGKKKLLAGELTGRACQNVH